MKDTKSTTIFIKPLKSGSLMCQLHSGEVHHNLRGVLPQTTRTQGTSKLLNVSACSQENEYRFSTEGKEGKEGKEEEKTAVAAAATAGNKWWWWGGKWW